MILREIHVGLACWPHGNAAPNFVYTGAKVYQPAYDCAGEIAFRGQVTPPGRWRPLLALGLGRPAFVPVPPTHDPDPLAWRDE